MSKVGQEKSIGASGEEEKAKEDEWNNKMRKAGHKNSERRRSSRGGKERRMHKQELDEKQKLGQKS